MHAECTVPPVKNSDAIKFLHCADDCLLVRFVAAMNYNAAAKYWATHIESVESANVSTGFTNGGTEPTKGSWDVVELTVKGDGKCGVGKN
jgi:hypothetical protein